MDCRRYLQLLFAAACLVAQGVTQTGVNFIAEPPTNTVAEEGDEVLCPCEYTGTKAVALWNINGTSYDAVSLPSGFYANASGLVLIAEPHLTHTTFQCFLVLYNSSSGEFFNLYSNIGELISGDYVPFTEETYCKPKISGVSAARTHEQDAELNITWIPDKSPECQNISYLVELYTCREYSQLCSIMTNYGETQVEIAASNCSGVNIDQPLTFTVKAEHNTCENSDPSDMWNCYSSYGYTTTLMDTDVVDVDEGQKYPIPRPTEDICSDYEICVVKLPEINHCSRRSNGRLIDLPEGYNFSGGNVCIDDVKQSLHNAIHTIWCNSFEVCPGELRQFAVKRVLKRNFKLVVHSQENAGDRLCSSFLVGIMTLGVVLLTIGL